MDTVERPVHDKPLRTSVDWLTRSHWRSFILIFVIAFAIRGFFLTRTADRYVIPHTRWELEATAYALAERGEFADPYMVPSGPTAHLPPIMPGILALIWRLFGLGLAGGYAGWLFRIATYCAMYAMLPWLAGRLGVGRQAGLIAGIAGALIAQWPGHGEALTAIAMGLLLLACLRRWAALRISVGGSLLLGLAWGVAFHLQPALLTVFLGCVAFELWWRRDRRKWALSAVMILGVVLACLPWGLRNYARFDAVFFIRSNLGLELRMGNHEGAAAAMDVMDSREEHRHPRTHETEALLLREVGEVAYMRGAGREAVAWISSHPGEFLRLTASRVVHWWCGPLHAPTIALLVTVFTLLALLGAWRTLPGLTIPQRAALLIPLATYPLIYYVVAYMGRYRVPMDWIVLVFAGAAVWRWLDRH
jgi:4-amino-4-deoxy-L-arabinose transferase-like glycosyltransferase